MRGFTARALLSAISTLTLALSLSTTAQSHAFKIIGNSDQTQQIDKSLAACQNLGATLDRLARSAGFEQIRVTTSVETKRTGPFLAAVSGSEIIVAADWLTLQSQPYSDVRREGEILPDNLCFDFGHLSDHIAHPISPPTGTDVNAWLKERMNAESRAFLRGWPFVLEAARAKNNGKPLGPAQIGGLLINLRYRFAFLQAMAPNSSPKLSILSDGSIPETDANVAAVSAALSHSTIADLQ